MSERWLAKNRILLALAAFFEKALDALKPAYMKLLVVFVVVVLLALLLEKGSMSPGLGLGLVVAVVLIFACLAAALQYAEMRFLYTKRTEEELKKALRDTVIELQAEKMGQVSSSNARITYIEYDPPGDDVQGEFVRIDNDGRIVIDMTDWTLCDEAGHLFTFPVFTLRPGAYVRVWTKASANTATDLHWGRGQAVWNNTGDCAYLRDSTGAQVDTYCY